MPITERTLKRWRKDALEQLQDPNEPYAKQYVDESSKRILRMSQELLDAHLLRKK